MILTQPLVRAIRSEDRIQLANLIHFEALVHRHLDWRPPLEWIGHQPFLVLEEAGNIHAALASPPDPPDVAWIRLFAVSGAMKALKAWELLWPATRDLLSESPGMVCAGIPLSDWFKKLLQLAGFTLNNRVVMLVWEGAGLPDGRRRDSVQIRPMTPADMEHLEGLDNAAFAQLWRNSKSSLELAFRQSALASVAEIEDQLVGYQISTASPMGGHLARLAVLPQMQGRGIGYLLLKDLLSQFRSRGAQRVTVNTQQDNIASLALYKKAGFQLTGEAYPVFHYEI